MSLSTGNPSPVQPTVFPREFWGGKRHEYIATVADKLLSDRAREIVQELLQPLGQSSLAEIATWADELKTKPPNDDETNNFLKDFPADVARNWHFVNLPHGVTGYSRQKYPMFTGDWDVVQMINKSVDVLQGNSNIMSKVNALRWLTHLVGDVHQPVHVACCYIDEKAQPAMLLSDPDEINEKGITRHDRGGNDLILPFKSTKLHSYWDSVIPEVEAEAPPPEEGVNIIMDHIEKNNLAATVPEGPPNKWAEQWAMDSIKASREAYKSIKITTPKGKDFNVDWEGKESYDKRCSPLVSKQMALASQRLATLINELFK